MVNHTPKQYLKNLIRTVSQDSSYLFCINNVLYDVAYNGFEYYLYNTEKCDAEHDRILLKDIENIILCKDNHYICTFYHKGEYCKFSIYKHERPSELNTKFKLTIY
jgi:hypothetical protein